MIARGVDADLGEGRRLLPASGEQPEVPHEDVQVWFSDPAAQKETLYCWHVGGGRGRIEPRISTALHNVGWLQDLRSKRRQ